MKLNLTFGQSSSDGGTFQLSLQENSSLEETQKFKDLKRLLVDLSAVTITGIATDSDVTLQVSEDTDETTFTMILQSAKENP